MSQLRPRGRRAREEGMAVDFDTLPKFADLPVKADAPADSTWGLWGTTTSWAV